MQAHSKPWRPNWLVYLGAKLNSLKANYNNNNNNNSIQLIYLCAKLNSPEANYKVSTGKKIRRVRRK
jgi:hypothetical protein